MTAKITYEGQLGTRCLHVASDSTISTDAPTDNNGKGENFSPTDLVATSLAACMITVMGIRAAKSDIAFERVSADIIKIMNADPRRIKEIKLTLYVEDEWSRGERELLEKVGRNCPVALSLHPDIHQTIVFEYL